MPPVVTGEARASSGDRPPGLYTRLHDRFSHLFHELAKFGVVGGLTYLVDLGTFNVFLQVLDLGPLTSKTLSTSIAASLAFLGNRFWTWRHRVSSGLTREYFLYFVFNAVGLLMSLLVLGFSHYILGGVWPDTFKNALADNIAGNLVGISFGTLFRFWSYRRWVFLPPDAPPVDPTTGLPESDEARQSG